MQLYPHKTVSTSLNRNLIIMRVQDNIFKMLKHKTANKEYFIWKVLLQK